MKQINQLFNIEKYQEKKINSERASIISEFVEEINKERIGTKFKKIQPRAVAIKLGHIKNKQDLYYFLSTCKDYKKRNGSFSKCFFGALKVK